MRISPANLRANFVVLVITLSSIPAVLPRTTADQSVSLSDISKNVLPMIVSLTTENAGSHPGTAATGFLIGYGVIATDYRVVKDAIKIQAASSGEDAVDVTIVAVDERRTVAFLLKTVQEAPRTSDSETSQPKPQKRVGWTESVERPRVGDDVYLFSAYASAGGGLLPGKIDELREEAGTTFFHLAGGFGQDSVGSPVLNAQGKLIGMLVANHADGGAPSFAIPADQMGGCGGEGLHINFSGGAPGGGAADSTKRSGNENTVTSSPAGADSSPQPIRKSGGVLQASALRKAHPLYPPLAKAARVSGAVVVEVTVDEEGDVISARAISGHPLMKDCAVAAARGWKFTPTTLSGSPVKVVGTITFNFTIGDEPSVPHGNTSPGTGVGGAVIEPSSGASASVDSRPVPLNRPRPGYTELARANGTQGSITVRALVGSDGLVKQVKIVRGLPDGLNEEAQRSIYQMQFKPAMKDGQPVSFWLALVVEFHLRK